VNELESLEVRTYVDDAQAAVERAGEAAAAGRDVEARGWVEVALETLKDWHDVLDAHVSGELERAVEARRRP
jgi:hypothetical protein